MISQLSELLKAAKMFFYLVHYRAKEIHNNNLHNTTSDTLIVMANVLAIPSYTSRRHGAPLALILSRVSDYLMNIGPIFNLLFSSVFVSAKSWEEDYVALQLLDALWCLPASCLLCQSAGGAGYSGFLKAFFCCKQLLAAANNKAESLKNLYPKQWPERG